MKTLMLVLACACYAEEDTVAEALASGGVILDSQGKREAAEQAFLRAIGIDPNCGQALYALGAIYERKGDKVAAARLYAMVTGKQRPDAERAIARVNPCAAKLAALLSAYAAEVDQLISRRPDLIQDATGTVTRLGLALPSKRKFFRGERMADVAFYETMGYEIGEFKTGAPSHVGHYLKYKVPDELTGLRYTLVVSGQLGQLRVRFKTDGALIVLFNRLFQKEDRQKLEKLGTKIDMPDITNDTERYEPFLIRGKTGDTLNLIFYVLLAEKLEKGK